VVTGALEVGGLVFVRSSTRTLADEREGDEEGEMSVSHIRVGSVV
jgi:hypothetical protein